MRERIGHLVTIVGIVALLGVPVAAYMGACGAREQPATTPALHKTSPTTLAPGALATCSNLAIDGECGGIVSALSLLGSATAYSDPMQPFGACNGPLCGATITPTDRFALFEDHSTLFEGHGDAQLNYGGAWTTIGPSILSITEPSVTRNIGVYVDTYAGGAQAVVEMIERGTLTIGDIDRIATEVCAKCRPGELCDRLVVKNHADESYVWSCDGKLYEEKSVNGKAIRVEVRSR